MQDETNQDPPVTAPRVIADYGGRRKVFERRLKQSDLSDADRRSGSDRRSGFDRRRALSDQAANLTEKRNDFPLNQK